MVPNRFCCEAESVGDGASANQRDIELVVVIWHLRYCDFACSYDDAYVVCDVTDAAFDLMLLFASVRLHYSSE